MKKSFPVYLSVVFLLGLLGLGSCRKDDNDAPGFDLLLQRDFEVPAGISPFQVHYFTLTNVPTNYKALLSTYAKTDADIGGIINVEGSLTSQFGDAQLDFIQRISIVAFPTDEPTKKLEVSYRDPTPLDTGNLLGLIPSLADVKEQLNQESVSLQLIVFTRYTTQETIPMRLDLRFRAKFK